MTSRTQALIYLSPVPWASHAQRPHAFARWFNADRGGPVLWIDPYPTRLPGLADLRGAPYGAGERTRPDWLSVVRPRAVPVEPLPGVRTINRALWSPVLRRARAFAAGQPTLLVVGKPSLLALALLDAAVPSVTLYDAMDDFPAFYTGLSRRTMASSEERLVNAVTSMFVSSTALAEKWRPVRPVVLVHNGFDADTIPAPSRAPIGDTLLGYVGTIGHWFDWQLVAQLAHAAPEATIRIIGPLHSPPPPLPPTVEILPAMPHDAAVKAMGEFSAGIIPFVQSRLTRAVDPIKYYEYRACGVPVISSEFGEMLYHRHQPGVFMVAGSNGGRDLGAVVSAALAHRDDFDDTSRFRCENSWAARFDAAGIP